MKTTRDLNGAEARELLEDVAEAIAAAAARRGVQPPRFVLLMEADRDPPHYVSSWPREKAILALRACAERLDPSPAPIEGLGPTGDFPDGSIRDDDQGEIGIALGADAMNQTVILQFGKRIAWLGLRPADARALARALSAQADRLDGGVGERSA